MPDLALTRAAHVAARAVLAISAALAVVEVWRVGEFQTGTDLLVAAVATALFLPLHLWHLSYGLRGERPPHSAPTLAAVAAIHITALVIIGPAWSFMLAVLATSAMVVLRPPWSFAALALCAAGPALGTALHHDANYYAHVPYLTYSVVFRSMIQFAIVWLAAAARQLAASRSALAAEATEQERARLQDEVRASLERRLDALADAGAAARLAIAGPGLSAPLVALDTLLRIAREALSDLREVVAGARRPPAHEAAGALASTVRFGRTPVGRGLATRQAWRIYAVVQVVVLLFPLLAITNALDIATEPHPAAGAVAWAAIAALQLSTSLQVARGHTPSRPWLRLAAMLVLVFGTITPLGADFETVLWFVGSMALMCLPRRWALAGGVAAIAGFLAWDTFVYTLQEGNWPLRLVLWNAGYLTVVASLVVAGLYASARLVAIVSELDAARDRLAQHAARSERRRMSRDLHDVLGQALTAISLKGDLARRVVATDRAAAAVEIAALAELTASTTAEVEAVARGEREVAFATETEAAVDLLRAAGVAVRTDVRVDGLDAEVSSLLGWAVREGATNILRHADARECEIRAAADGDVLRLELVNDGVRPPRRVGGGTGLASLADRAHAARGSAAGASAGDGRFVLRVEVPR